MPAALKFKYFGGLAEINNANCPWHEFCSLNQTSRRFLTPVHAGLFLGMFDAF